MTEKEMALKTLEVQSSWDGPTSRETIIEVGAWEGDRRVPASAAECRVAVGWVESGSFRTLGVAAEFSCTGRTTIALRWAPPHGRTESQWRRLAQVQLAAIVGAAVT
ncbi:MAG: hypothetical protein QM784_35785 [Polyangiaceae bacterium]